MGAVQSVGQPCRRAWLNFIQVMIGRHFGWTLDERDLLLISSQWSSLVARFKENENPPNYDHNPTGAAKRIYNSVTHGMTGIDAMREWVTYCDVVKSEYAIIRRTALKYGTKEILDDSDQQLTAEQARAQLEDGKRARTNAREETFRILQQDAQAAVDMRQQYVEMGRNIVSLFGTLMQTHQMTQRVCQMVFGDDLLTAPAVVSDEGSKEAELPTVPMAPESINLENDVAAI